MNGKRANILILLSDQLRRQALSVYGDPDARTRHHDLLRQRMLETEDHLVLLPAWGRRGLNIWE